MAQFITIILETVDVFQIMDAITIRAESWEKTHTVLNGDFESESFFVPEECHDAAEAATIAKHFRTIKATLEAQLNKSE